MDNKEYLDLSAIPFGRSELRFPNGLQLSTFRMGDGKSRVLSQWSGAGDYTVSFSYGYNVADTDWDTKSDDEKFSDPDFQLIFDNVRSVDALMVCLEKLKGAMTSGDEKAGDEKIANGHHYKLSEITEDDVGRLMGLDFLVEKMGLNWVQRKAVKQLMRPLVAAEVERSFIGLAFDPFFVDTKMMRFIAIDFTIFKKIVRFGKGSKTEEQDRADIIGACKSGIELSPMSAQSYEAIIEFMGGSNE